MKSNFCWFQRPRAYDSIWFAVLSSRQCAMGGVCLQYTNYYQIFLLQERPVFEPIEKKYTIKMYPTPSLLTRFSSPFKLGGMIKTHCNCRMSQISCPSKQKTRQIVFSRCVKRLCWHPSTKVGHWLINGCQLQKMHCKFYQSFRLTIPYLHTPAVWYKYTMVSGTMKWPLSKGFDCNTNKQL